jgi:catechol 2,3-dioxygenase-like lactoylglutathione lyase family enzyme
MSGITNYKIKQISPQFIVADIERSISFYTQILGFTVDFRYEDFYAAISREGCSIHLKSGKPSTRENEKRNNEDLDIVVAVEKIENLFEELSGKPIQVTQRLRSMPYGKEFYAADPDGYILGFVEEHKT